MRRMGHINCVLVALVLLCLMGVAVAEDYGTVTLTERISGSMSKLIYSWVSDATGRASVTTGNYFTGRVIAAVTIPGASPNAPTDNYDVTVSDGDGHDVLLGNGIDRDETNTELIKAEVLPAVVDSRLRLSVANAGNAKRGTVVLWLQD